MDTTCMHKRPPSTGRLPLHVEVMSEHDQRCSLTFTLGRHNEVHERALRPLIKAAGFFVATSKVSKLTAALQQSR